MVLRAAPFFDVHATHFKRTKKTTMGFVWVASGEEKTWWTKEGTLQESRKRRC